MFESIQTWHKDAKQELNNYLNTLTEDEVMMFGIQEGYIEKETGMV